MSHQDQKVKCIMVPLSLHTSSIFTGVLYSDRLLLCFLQSTIVKSIIAMMGIIFFICISYLFLILLPFCYETAVPVFLAFFAKCLMAFGIFFPSLSGRVYPSWRVRSLTYEPTSTTSCEGKEVGLYVKSSKKTQQVVEILFERVAIRYTFASDLKTKRKRI